MANAQNSKSFRESLKVKNVDHSKAQAAAKAKSQSSSSGGPGQTGNQCRTKGGMTRKFSQFGKEDVNGIQTSFIWFNLNTT